MSKSFIEQLNKSGKGGTLPSHEGTCSHLCTQKWEKKPHSTAHQRHLRIPTAPISLQVLNLKSWWKSSIVSAALPGPAVNSLEQGMAALPECPLQAGPVSPTPRPSPTPPGAQWEGPGRRCASGRAAQHRTETGVRFPGEDNGAQGSFLCPTAEF